MSFVRRRIDVKITLGSGDFGDAGSSNTVTLTGLRVSANIVKGASPTFDWADVRIYGMTPSQMNSVSRLGKPLMLVRNNGVQVLAGDDDSGMALVFQGTIQTASQNFQDSPNVALNIGAQGGGLAAMAPVAPISVQGSADVATLMTQIAGSMTPALTVENNGVSVQLSNPYLPGTAADQMKELADAANIYARIEEESGTLAIWPKDASRGDQAPLISATTGMIGPPTYADVGISVRALFFPGVKVGANINVQSAAVPQASGTWRVMQHTLDLESETPGGAWFQDMVCNAPGSGDAS